MLGIVAKFAGGALGKVMGALGLSKIQLIVLVALLTVIGGQTLAIKIMGNKIETKTALLAAEQVAHEITKAEHKEFEKNVTKQFELNAQAIGDLATAREEAVREKDRLSKKLLKHDFPHLAREKPGLIERHVNKATAEVFQKMSNKVIDNETAQIILWNEHYGYPCWLLHTTTTRLPDFLPGCSIFYRRSSPATETGPSAPKVRSLGPKAREHMRKGNQRTPSPYRSASQAVRGFGDWCFRDPGIHPRARSFA